MVERLSEGPYGGKQYEYREWMRDKIEDYTGHLYDIGNLHADTMEKLYKAIVKKNPEEQFRLERT